TRRETVTDLSNLLSLSKPTLLEHLEKLQSAGLVKRVDEGRKWIYYELSDKGRKILHPERVAITLVLGLAVALAAIGAFLVISASSGGLVDAPAYNASAPAARSRPPSASSTRSSATSSSSSSRVPSSRSSCSRCSAGGSARRRPRSRSHGGRSSRPRSGSCWSSRSCSSGPG